MNEGTLVHNGRFFHHFSHPFVSFIPPQSCTYPGYLRRLCNVGLQVSSSDADLCHAKPGTKRWRKSLCYGACSFGTEISGLESDGSLYIQTLKDFPVEELLGKSVLVRFDSAILMGEATHANTHSLHNACHTIRYLYEAGSKVLLVSSWERYNHRLASTHSVADYLSSVLLLKVRSAKSETKEAQTADILLLENLTDIQEELANSSVLAKKLSSGIDIFVNDAMSISHKILASTVGVTQFSCASMAGFYFEAELSHLMQLKNPTKQPYIVIIGGGNFALKASALRYLITKCDGMVFIGRLAFQIMNALGLPVPSAYVEPGAIGDALEIVRIAHGRKVQILCPKDFYSAKKFNQELEIVPVSGFLEGWKLIDVGPTTLNEIFSLLSKAKKVLWIGSEGFDSSMQQIHGASNLARMLEKIRRTGCDITVVGSAACNAVLKTSGSLSAYNVLEKASVVWALLKGKTLPAVAALDRAYPFEVEWSAVFDDPTLPLVVDIGSGNGLFLLGMARIWKHSNFLGLEINKKLVKQCLKSVLQDKLKNVHFISTNATSTFRPILSSYLGDVVLVSIQCPNPDFNNRKHRWRMLQRGLVEAITDLLITDGKVFLQSDIEEVSTRMKEQFLTYGKGKFAITRYKDIEYDKEGWLKENPLGVRSDWERHVLDRGAPMYRLMISKVKK
ncbi:hypothetical protein H6P81_017524 [Aristolochia fimbriata]|uniref:Phosphoglycerate kinase n=1 Tax=Aristolochia fimbriata TaxID=158543 RepID=A0AAV7E0D6_ARIFI|nr:hypothetical protein H6P81_017524 [Aristolochia fimbriata]